MELEILEKFTSSMKYRDYDTAIFLASYISEIHPKYKILLPIALYTNQEYPRALFHLKEISTYTGRFYQALCLKAMKDYKNALLAIRQVLEKKVSRDVYIGDIIQQWFFVDSEADEYYLAIEGDLLSHMRDREAAINSYSNSYHKSPTYRSAKNLLLENAIPAVNHQYLWRANGIIIEYIKDLAIFTQTRDMSLIKKYSKMVPGIGSYFISDVARVYFNLGLNEESKKWFEVIRNKDPFFLDNIDFYSTVLWHQKDVADLGTLCRSLVKYYPSSPITWKALGNFYSHKNDYQRSLMCFKRSLSIEENSYTYTLLGYESISRNEFDSALEYFNTSINMHLNNYRAVFGCAQVYLKIEKLDNAEYFIDRALEMNPLNLPIKVHAMKFYIKKGILEGACRILNAAFDFGTISPNEIADKVVERKGKFSEVEEFLLLEFIDVLLQGDSASSALNVLQCIAYRGESYHRKKEMITAKLDAK